MHCHEQLRFNLFDLNNRLYRTHPIKAIASIQADQLNHRPVFIHPDIEVISKLDLEIETDGLNQAHHRQNSMWQTVGKIALSILVTELILGI
ncbi:hypothetical protein [Solemya velesiana gill symbiont]|uniref:hypothetical protein n=1 Tax=Solemya velesiana gill symbiont TaxID=1918948 RepID=UPI0010838650|nr:hypothetical protein [Solemya velesiana gill symbiont]